MSVHDLVDVNNSLSWTSESKDLFSTIACSSSFYLIRTAADPRWQAGGVRRCCRPVVPQELLLAQGFPWATLRTIGVEKKTLTELAGNAFNGVFLNAFWIALMSSFRLPEELAKPVIEGSGPADSAACSQQSILSGTWVVDENDLPE